MKQFIKKQNSKFAPYGNYSVEKLLKEEKVQQQEYLDKPAQEHIDELIAMHSKFKSSLNSDTVIDIKHITENVNEYIEISKKFLKYSVEDYYKNHVQLICEITMEEIPYDTDYFYIDCNHDTYIILSENGLKQFIKQAIECLTNNTPVV